MSPTLRRAFDEVAKLSEEDQTRAATLLDEWREELAAPPAPMSPRLAALVARAVAEDEAGLTRPAEDIFGDLGD